MDETFYLALKSGGQGQTNKAEAAAGDGISMTTNTASGVTLYTINATAVNGLTLSTERTLNLSNVTTLVETPIATNSHTLYSTNDLALETWLTISGATNYAFQHWDTYFRAGSFAYSNTLSGYSNNTSMTWARWATNHNGGGAVLYVKAGLTNEDSVISVKSTELFSTNGVVMAAPPEFEYFATTFNGSSQWATVTPTGVADGQKGTISLWLKINGADGTANTILTTADNSRIRITRGAGANTLELRCYDSSAVAVLAWESQATITSASGWVHLLASWDLSANTAHVYTNGVSADGGIWAKVNGGTADYTDGVWWLPQDTFNGCLSEVFIDIANYVDITDAGVRSRFASAGKPVDVSTSNGGSWATGAQPLIYLHGDYTTFGNNSGSGGNLTVTGGPLSTCTAP